MNRETELKLEKLAFAVHDASVTIRKQAELIRKQAELIERQKEYIRVLDAKLETSDIIRRLA